MRVYLGSSCLRITRLEIPSAVPRGSPVNLICHFELEKADLYSVKWYKDYVEFYRYLPSNEPEELSQMFQLKGAFVELSESNATHVYLWKTDLDSEGTYACEVSTTESFTTIRVERQMKVYVLPQTNLQIDNKQFQYNVEDYVNLTCISGASSPALNLTWFVNNREAYSHELVNYPTQSFPDGLYVARLGLVFHASREYFVKGVLQLKCSAALILTYQYEASELLIAGVSSNKSNNNNVHFSSKNLFLKPERETPVIRGGQARYSVGDLLYKNCSSSSNEVLLQWYINEEQVNDTYLVRRGEKDACNCLGLRFHMQQQHFQIPELKLRCMAIYHRTIADFHHELKIETETPETLKAQSSVDKSFDNNAIRG